MNALTDKKIEAAWLAACANHGIKQPSVLPLIFGILAGIAILALVVGGR